jgi:hypothetical protein
VTQANKVTDIGFDHKYTLKQAFTNGLATVEEDRDVDDLFR